MRHIHIDFRLEQQLDSRYFSVIVGEHWANNELQHYVNKKDNLFFTDEGMILRATHPQKDIYESIRINSKHKLSFTYGEIKIVAKVPSGVGTWPALWMMSEDNPYGTWPRSGEIDIMEHVGRNKNNVFLCLHSETYNHTRKLQRYKEHIVEDAISTFHEYGLKWEENSITYFIDGVEVAKYSKYDLKDHTTKGWPFDHNYFLIMNLAIGGSFGGSVDDTMFPQDFIIQSIDIKY